MLRSFQGKTLGVRTLLTRNASLSTVTTAGPSTKTTVILTNLHESVTLTQLQDALKDVKQRKIELQPGCALHFVEQSQAETVAQYLSQKNNNFQVCILFIFFYFLFL